VDIPVELRACGDHHIAYDRLPGGESIDGEPGEIFENRVKVISFMA
jgi:hypothetical protein